MRERASPWLSRNERTSRTTTAIRVSREMTAAAVGAVVNRSAAWMQIATRAAAAGIAMIRTARDRTGSVTPGSIHAAQASSRTPSGQPASRIVPST